MPRFVLLRHECPVSFGKPSHWDLMLEWGEVLRTWELRKLPNGWTQGPTAEANDAQVEAFSLPDHRVAYLDFEGALSGNRGTVQRVDHGTFELMSETDDLLEVQIQGELTEGKLLLERLPNNWRLTLFIGGSMHA